MVAEFQGQTQINFPDVLTILSSANTLPTAATVTLPFAALDSLEAVEGMLVTIPETLYVTEFFQLGRFGEVLVSSDDRLPQPTANVAPGAPAQAMQAANDLNQLIIDDALNNQNADPIVYGGNGAPLTAANPLRGGDTITGATGVMTYTWAGNSASGNAYRLRPATVPIAFQTANPRPTSAPGGRRLAEGRQLQRPQLLPHARRRWRRLRPGWEQAGVPRCQHTPGVRAPAHQADGGTRRPRRRHPRPDRAREQRGCRAARRHRRRPERRSRDPARTRTSTPATSVPTRSRSASSTSRQRRARCVPTRSSTAASIRASSTPATARRSPSRSSRSRPGR